MRKEFRCYSGNLQIGTKLHLSSRRISFKTQTPYVLSQDGQVEGSMVRIMDSSRVWVNG